MKISEKRLEELLKIMETHCTWFPDMGTIDIDQWEEVGKNITEKQLKGEDIPNTIWETWRQVKSVLESLHTDTEDEEDEKNQDCKIQIGFSEDEGEGESLEAPTVIPKVLYPSLSNLLTPDHLPSPPITRMKDWGLSKPSKSKRLVSSAVLAPPPYAQGPLSSMSAIEKGIQQARIEGDLEALNFPVVVRDRVGPNDEYPDGVELVEHQPFPFKILKELKQAVTQFGPTSPYTIGLIRGIADGNRMVPIDWNASAKACLSPAQFLQFKSWWVDGAEIQSRQNQAAQISITKDQLVGDGDWLNTEQQIRMNRQAQEQLKRLCLSAWEKIEVEGKAPTSFQNIFQGPQEPYSECIARLQDTIKKQVSNAQAAEIILHIIAYENANEDCKKAIGAQKGKTDAVGYLRLCQGVGTEQYRATMLAQAITGMTKGNKFPGPCFNCGKPGHTKKDRRKKIKNVSYRTNGFMPVEYRSPGICPRCQKGRHWASECRSLYHKDGTPLQGNGKRGPPQAATTTGAYVTSAVPQNYQAVPPPNFQYSN